MSIHVIPADAMLRILTCLNNRQISAMMNTSKHFKSLIDDILHNFANPILKSDLNFHGYSMLLDPLTHRLPFVGVDYIQWKGNEARNS